ncbi:MAG: hypothetical protein IKV03_00825 [Alphaproteobacteria bacterium]|nr:hypothetical protein [Alphaproteobacteria bacterium]
MSKENKGSGMDFILKSMVGKMVVLAGAVMSMSSASARPECQRVVVQPREVVYVPVQPTRKVCVVTETIPAPVGITVKTQKIYFDPSSGFYYINVNGHRVRYIKNKRRHLPPPPPPCRRCIHGTIGHKGGYLGKHR